ncbi:MAG: metallophosphoesterase [Acidobacteria bacterium]|nr:metallophosphoesterase [Acidobacteriota bacterium]
MKLAHVADLHFGAARMDVLAAAQDAILNARPDALIVSGDVSQRGKRVEFAAAREWVDEIGLPSLVVPGNHDTPLLNVHARATAPFARYRDYFGDLTRSLKIGSGRIDPLNTARGWQARKNWAEGSVRLSDLEAAIEASGSAHHPHLLACHHPFRSMQGALLRTETRRGDIASQRVAASPVSVVLTGHVHTPHVEEVVEPGGKYLAVSAGTLSTRLRRAPPGFNMLSFSPDKVSVTAFALSGDVFVAQPTLSYRLNQAEPGDA